MIGSVNTGGGSGAPDLNGSIIRVTANVGANVTVRKGAAKYQYTFSGRIPSAYQEVEYIESSGTQYINTRIPRAVPLKIKTTIQPVSYSTSPMDNIVCGGYNDDNHIFWALDIRSDSFGVRTFYNGSSTINIVSANYVLPTTRFSEVETFISEGQQYIKIDNQTKGEGTLSGQTLSGAADLYLFASNSKGSAANFARVKLKRTTIEIANEIVRDFIPCYRKSDNAVGMYDLISTEFFANSGTGAFSKGENITSYSADFTVRYSGRWTVTAEQSGQDTVAKYVDVIADNTVYPVNIEFLVPSAYQTVEFLQSSGTQYIKTGLTGPLISYGYEIDFSVLSDGFFLGATDTKPYFGLIYRPSGTAYFGANENGDHEGPSITSNERHLLTYSCTLSGTKSYEVDGVTYSTTLSSSYVIANLIELYLFCRHDTAGAASLMSAKIYRLKIRDNSNTLLRDFVPCYRKSDNVAGLWDAVNKVFYTNDGSGTFVVGEPI